ncbi:MAG: RidA family protein [Chloroflexota bacterium]|nr:MAG: RidA family protein [Chloroflexota bacterium]
MKREIVRTDKAPAAVGPYSQAVRVGHFVFTAGQVGIDPAAGKIADEDVVGQTHQVMRNLREVLRQAGTDLDKVVKTTVFLQDMGHFKAMNDVYGGYFGDQPPARSTVEVAQLPLGALVEIEAIALVT